MKTIKVLLTKSPAEIATTGMPIIGDIVEITYPTLHMTDGRAHVVKQSNSSTASFSSVINVNYTGQA